MNERIRELINEATSFKEGLIEEKYDIEVFDKEKVAELILKETMQVVANNLTQTTYLDVADAVVEHFGDEE